MDTMFPKEDSCSGNYPIIDVCCQGYDDLLQWLLNNGSNVNEINDHHVTPLMIASAYGNTDIVVMLLKQKPDVNIINTKQMSALFLACTNNNILVVEKLLQQDDIDVNVCNAQRQSPLFAACCFGWKAIIKNLLQKRPNVNQGSDNGFNPLHAACFYGHTDVVTLLLESTNVYVDVDACDIKAYTPLIIACSRNLTEISSLLIHAKSDVDIQILNCATALCFAALYDNYDTTELLLENKASWQTGLRNKQQIIDALSNHPERTFNEVKEEIKVLFVTHVESKFRDYVSKMPGDYFLDVMLGSSPLHIACLMGHMKIARCILNSDAYVDFTKEDGSTPLFYACELGHADVVRLLLDMQADVNIRRQDGKSALDIAELNGHQSIVNMLRERRAD